MNTAKRFAIEELHWIVGLVHNLEVGLVVLDRDYRICLWNGFMENHSGMPSRQVLEKNLFSQFPSLPEAWLTKKIESVFLLDHTSYSIWEQRPYLFEFKSHRPITGDSAFMYQNVTILPLSSPTGEIEHIGVLVYDVTDIALNQKELESANEQLKLYSRTDGLTGLYNRTYWQECIEKEFDLYSRTSRVSSLIMFDIDHFKKVNDTYGHPAGDLVIQTIANILCQFARKTDILGRYGGEEYGVLLINTNANNAKIFCERLREAIQTTVMEHAGDKISVTVSLGISEIDLHIDSVQQWLEEADQALYKSKQTGRNKVTIYQYNG